MNLLFLVGLKMKHSIKRLFAVLLTSVPLAAQAYCESYSNSQHGLTLPAVINVPASLPLGSEILRQPFNGVLPDRFLDCPTHNLIVVIARQLGPKDPIAFSSPTEAPGVGIRIRITDARGSTNNFALTSGETVGPPGRIPIFTKAEAIFYKIGPVTGGVMPAGNIFDYRMRDVRNNILGRYQLLLDSPVRFVSPAATCDLAAGDVNRTISLDPVQASAFEAAPFAGVRDFELSANCSEASSVTFRFSGTPAPENTLLFANTGTAGGVALWLYSRINGVARTLSADGSDNERTLAVSGDRAVLPLSAAYHRNGTVSQGTLTSTATVNITYN
ncbi:fimbrial protein, putative [Pseudomonas fluorescens BRIP34879]|uniref:fimbrial protein n=1 Tax=Pseudomonas poae TaxID=200451 RepID=UPI0002A7AF55|nr:fimbrial protein [Pseudomonas poae]ELQ12795.1 fimbrial protein, putative [Pseudomonas fluorescens BRIP34879]MBC3197560.1 fimbrial protein [Pseudomonas poae]